MFTGLYGKLVKSELFWDMDESKSSQYNRSEQEDIRIVGGLIRRSSVT